MFAIKKLSYIKHVFLTLFCITLFFPCKSINQSNETFLDQAGNPSKPLLELLSLLEIEHNGTLPSIVQATQKSWIQAIRPANKERWEIEERIKENFEKKREQIIPLFKQIGLYDSCAPQQQHYDYALILGCRLVGMCNRLKTLINLTIQGVSFDKIIFLSGESPLMNEETRETLEQQFKTTLAQNHLIITQEDFPNNESSLLEYIVEHTIFPKSWQKIEKVFIRSPMKKSNQGILTSPTTGDTVQQWLEKNPKNGSILAISDQPHCLYQQAVLKTLLPNNFEIETVGAAISEKTSVALMLDALARALYQENEKIKKNN